MYDPLSIDVAKIIDREHLERTEAYRLSKHAQARRPRTLHHSVLSIANVLMALGLALKVR
jgi:hypothetical protein